MTKLISLSASDTDHNWFATSSLFAWATDFVLAQIDDPRLLEDLSHQVVSGYLFVGELPEPHRSRVLTALRDGLPAAVDHDLYPLPVAPRDREFAARAKRLSELSRDLCPGPNPVQDTSVTAARDRLGWWLGFTSGRHGSRSIVGAALSGLANDEGRSDEELERLTGCTRVELANLAARSRGLEVFTPGEADAVQAALATYARPDAFASPEECRARLGCDREDIAALATHLTRALEAASDEPPAR